MSNKADITYLNEMLRECKNFNRCVEQCRDANVPELIAYQALGMQFIQIGERLGLNKLSQSSRQHINLAKKLKALRNLITHEYDVTYVKEAIELMPEFRKQIRQEFNRLTRGDK